MERRVIIRGGKQRITKECMEKFWEYLVTERKCVNNCKSHALVFAGRDILKCLICGKRYYREFPERPYNSEVCMLCGCFYVKSEGIDYNVCPECMKTHTIKNKRRCRKSSGKSEATNAHFT